MAARKGLGLANKVTLGRGVFTVIVWVLLVCVTREFSEALTWTAFVLFALAAATDFVDGALARRMQDVSVFGRIADPLVDKMLTIGTMIVMLGMPVVHPALPPWIVALGFAGWVAKVIPGIRMANARFQNVGPDEDPA